MGLNFVDVSATQYVYFSGLDVYFFALDDGSMPNYLREKSLVTLQKDPECTVMLISLKCGSLG